VASPAVPLARALLCLDCAQITAPRGARCPVCGSTALLGLARVLDRPAGPGDAGRSDERLETEALVVSAPAA
jgi:hypothetical protein